MTDIDFPELRKKLDQLDDREINALAHDYFPRIYNDKISSGVYKIEKITALLDHCRRHPEDVKRLEEAIREFGGEKTAAGLKSSKYSRPEVNKMSKDNNSVSQSISTGNIKVSDNAKVVIKNVNNGREVNASPEIKKFAQEVQDLIKQLDELKDKSAQVGKAQAELIQALKQIQETKKPDASNIERNLGYAQFLLEGIAKSLKPLQKIITALGVLHDKVPTIFS